MLLKNTWNCGALVRRRLCILRDARPRGPLRPLLHNTDPSDLAKTLTVLAPPGDVVDSKIKFSNLTVIFRSQIEPVRTIRVRIEPRSLLRPCWQRPNRWLENIVIWSELPQHRGVPVNASDVFVTWVYLFEESSKGRVMPPTCCVINVTNPCSASRDLQTWCSTFGRRILLIRGVDRSCLLLLFVFVLLVGFVIS